jgi:hypothetical protein
VDPKHHIHFKPAKLNENPKTKTNHDAEIYSLLTEMKETNPKVLLFQWIGRARAKKTRGKSKEKRESTYSEEPQKEISTAG